jgi:hypothetical protein
MGVLFDGRCGVLCAAIFMAGTNHAHAQLSVVDANRPRLLPLQTAGVVAARPIECGAERLGTEGTSAWGLARSLDTAQRCLRLARGLTLVSAHPEVVLAWYGNLDPEKKAPARHRNSLSFAERALQARAWLNKGEVQEAFRQFLALQEQSPLAQWHVLSIHDFAVSASKTGHFEIAITCYHRLLGLSAWLPRDMKIAVFVEAAAAVLHASPARASEGLGYLAELEPETLGPEVRHAMMVLRAAARGVVDPGAPVEKLTKVYSHGSAPSSLRLGAEDAAFLAACAQYLETGTWTAADNEPVSFSLPIYRAFIARHRGS